MISKWILLLRSYRKNTLYNRKIYTNITKQTTKKKHRKKKINLQTNQNSKSYEACKHIKEDCLE